MKPKFPVEKLSAKWVEQLNDQHEVVRVLFVGQTAVFRIVPNQAQTWAADVRDKYGWKPVRAKPRKGSYRCGPQRVWRSPEAAMRALESVYVTPEHKGTDQGDE